MRATPYITIYTKDDEHYFSINKILKKATLIFSKQLPYIRKLSRTRVNIYLGDEEGLHTWGSIKSVSLKYSAQNFDNTTEQVQINIVLKLIYDSLILIGNAESWDLRPFESAYDTALNGDQQLTWYTKLFSNTSKILKGRIRISVEEDDRTSIVAEFFNKKKEFLYEIHIIDTFMVHTEWFNTFSKPCWFNEEVFGFNLQSGQITIAANTKDKTISSSIKEKFLTHDELTGYLRMLQYKKFNSKEERDKWMNM